MSESLITWTEQLEMGIPPIDEQHRVLVDILNEFYAATQEHKGTEVGARILERLAEYTRIHFTVEESIMRLLDYPDYDDHKRLHDELMGTLQGLADKYASGKRSANFELIHFLKLWLVKHIQNSDREYADYFMTRGVRGDGKVVMMPPQVEGKTGGKAWTSMWQA